MGCPDLAVGVGIGAAHGGAFVFEDLHVGVLVFWEGDSEFWRWRGVEGGGGGEVGGVEGGPGADYGENGGGGEVCEGEVVGGVEADYVAFALCGSCAEEEGGFVCSVSCGGKVTAYAKGIPTSSVGAFARLNKRGEEVPSADSVGGSL